MYTIKLRQECPNDYYAVEELTREAFWDSFWENGQQICDTHLLVNKLRKISAFIPDLNYLAELDGEIVGHIIYTGSNIVDDSGKVHEVLTFGPLSVHPEYQSKGIGKALMYHTFSIAKDMGYRAVVIFGHADFYPRVGFKRAAEFGITTANGETYDTFMVCPLYDKALDGIQGQFYADPVYDSLTQEEVLKFDKKFPSKAKHTPVSIDILLNRLKPDAKKAIQKLGYHNIAEMQMKSQQEISALEGIDAKAVETICRVMQKHRLRWGKKRV